MELTATPLAGQTGIVTGAGKGLGFAVSRRLARAGLHTVLVDRDADAVNRAVDTLAAEGLAAEALVVDVTIEDDVMSAVADLAQRRGQIHILVNNAGVYPYVSFEDLDLAAWRRMLQINCDSAFLCSRAVFDAMRVHRYGRIVNFASSVFFNGVGGPAYVASKAANIGFTRSLALELGPYGITVNAVAPGLIDTEGLRGLGDRAAELFDATVPNQIVQRRGAPEDIAEAVAYIVDPASSFLTGQMVNVDGGARFH